MNPKSFVWPAALLLALTLAGAPRSVPASHGNDTDNIYAVQSRLSTPNFQLFLNIATDGSVVTSVPLYGPGFGAIGGVYSADFFGDDLYGTELDNSNLTDYLLVRVAHEGIMRGVAQRVSGTPIGFPAVEGLAVADGVIYGSSLDAPAHRTTLITIDSTTGIGTPVGTTSRNVMIVALAYDPVARRLYGAGTPWGGSEPSAIDTPNLYMMNMATGAETLIGDMGVHVQGMTWDVDLGLVGSFAKLYTIDPTTGAAGQLGTVDFTDGIPDSFNGLYAIGSRVPPGVGPPVGVCGDPVDPPTGSTIVARAVSATDTPVIPRAVSATDALFILQAAVAARTCELCICDVDNSGRVSATDALVILKVAVGQTIPLNCPTCT